MPIAVTVVTLSRSITQLLALTTYGCFGLANLFPQLI